MNVIASLKGVFTISRDHPFNRVPIGEIQNRSEESDPREHDGIRKVRL